MLWLWLRVSGRAKLAFIVAAGLTVWLVLELGTDRHHAATPAPSPPQVAAKPTELEDALAVAGRETKTCLEAIKAAFPIDRVVGSSPDSPGAPIAPARRADLVDAHAFDVFVLADRSFPQLLPMVQIPELDQLGYHDARAHPHVCGMYEDLEILDQYRSANAAASIAKLRAPQSPPPLVVYGWTWCDRHPNQHQRRRYTCSAGVVWMRLPSREIVAAASGVGHATPSAVDGEWDAFYAAESQAKAAMAAQIGRWH